MLRLLLGCVVLVACKAGDRAQPRPAPAPAPASAPADAAAPVGPGGLEPAELDALVRDVDEYTLRLTDLWVAPEASCEDTAKRFLELEPLTTKVRQRWLEMVAKAPDVAAAEQLIRERIRDRKSVMMPKIEARLAEHRMVLDDLGKREAALQARCGANAELAQARDRIGLFKRKQ